MLVSVVEISYDTRPRKIFFCIISGHDTKCFGDLRFSRALYQANWQTYSVLIRKALATRHKTNWCVWRDFSYGTIAVRFIGLDLLVTKLLRMGFCTTVTMAGRFIGQVS